VPASRFPAPAAQTTAQADALVTVDPRAVASPTACHLD